MGRPRYRPNAARSSSRSARISIRPTPTLSSGRSPTAPIWARICTSRLTSPAGTGRNRDRARDFRQPQGRHHPGNARALRDGEKMNPAPIQIRHLVFQQASAADADIFAALERKSANRIYGPIGTIKDALREISENTLYQAL